MVRNPFSISHPEQMTADGELKEEMNDLALLQGVGGHLVLRFPDFPASLAPGRVPHVRGLSRTWVEHDLFPMLSPPVYTYLQEGKRRGFPRISCGVWWRWRTSCGFPY